jgi:hypothetical protein
MVFRKRDRRGGRERDALVGGAEQHVELETGTGERGRITLAEHRDRFAIVEQPGVEEVRAVASGLELERAEAQSTARHGEVDESSLILLHVLTSV